MNEIPNFISHQECDEIIKMIDANHSRSSVVVGGPDRADITEHRTSSTSNLNPSNVIIQSVHKKIASTLGLEFSKGEALQGQLYEEGQYFKPHHDFFTGRAYDMHCLASGNRTHTLMLYLNDDFEGGETNFPQLSKSVKAEKGKALWWENMRDGKFLNETLHEGTPITKGKKYIATAWWRENRWDGAGDAQQHRDLTIAQDTQQTPQQAVLPKGESKIVKVNPISLEETTQPIPKLTPNGFKLTKCPPKMWGLILDCYKLLQDKETKEVFEGKDHYIPGDTTMLNFDYIPSVKKILHEELLPLHKEWCGVDIKPNYIYGIRSYQKGSQLKEHVDRQETHHVSSIIMVDKDLTCGCTNKKYAEDWPLDIKGHDGEWYKIYTQPGDMILYESALCEHARKEPFGGKFFRNFYIHYELKERPYAG